jgi:hypothetical protein
MRKSLAALAVAGIAFGGTYALSGAQSLAEEVTLYKTPGCQCCDGYAQYLRNNGFSVSVKPTHQLSQMGRKAGIPDDQQGCHLSFIEGYAVSGHVPITVVKKLLSERPAIKGVTLPGMPMGSPGMSGSKTAPFTIYEIGDGAPEVYAVK